MQNVERYIAVKLLSLRQNRISPYNPSIIFLGGMLRAGNHLLHSLLDGHKDIISVPEEDYFLRTNASSVINQMCLLYHMNFGNTDQKLKFLLEQNKNNNWLKIINKEAGEYEADFGFIDYNRLCRELRKMSQKRTFGLCHIYQSYIDCVLKSTPGIDGSTIQDYSYRLYFSANADFLIRPILSWDIRNKAIVPIRDPLQSFASLKNWQKSDFVCQPEKISGWKAVYQSYKLFRHKYKRRIFFVDYTELVNGVEKVMKQIAKFLSIEFDNILTFPTLLTNPIRGNTSYAGDGRKTGEVYKESLSRYKEILSEKEMDVINNELRPIYLGLTGERDES